MRCARRWEPPRTPRRRWRPGPQRVMPSPARPGAKRTRPSPRRKRRGLSQSRTSSGWPSRRGGSAVSTTASRPAHGHLRSTWTARSPGRPRPSRCAWPKIFFAVRPSPSATVGSSAPSGCWTTCRSARSMSRCCGSVRCSRSRAKETSTRPWVSPGAPPTLLRASSIATCKLSRYTTSGACWSRRASWRRAWP